MKCPFCGHKNITGDDQCESCNQNLSSLDGVTPKSEIEKVLMSDPITSLPPHRAVFASPDSNVLEIVELMNQGKTGAVVIVKNDELQGIVTERDITLKVVSEEKDPFQVLAKTIMTSDPQTLSEDDTLAYAVNLMSVRNFRHLPVLNGKKVIGIISIRDVIKHLSKLFP